MTAVYILKQLGAYLWKKNEREREGGRTDNKWREITRPSNGLSVSITNVSRQNIPSGESGTY